MQQIDLSHGLGAGTPTSSSFTVAVSEEPAIDYAVFSSALETVQGSAQKFFVSYTDPTKFASDEYVLNESVWNTWGKVRKSRRPEPLRFYIAFSEPVDPELFRSWREALERETLRIQSAFEKDAFIRQKPKFFLESKYKGKFVAIVDGKPVDFDSDDQRLAGRVLKKYGYRPAYLGYVGELKPELYIPPS